MASSEKILARHMEMTRWSRLVTEASHRRTSSNNACFCSASSVSCRGGKASPLSTYEIPSDQPPQEVKSPQYTSIEYEFRLEQKGSYMRESSVRFTDTGRNLCQISLWEEQKTPQDTLFRDDFSRKLVKRHEEGVKQWLIIRNTFSPICSSAENLNHLRHEKSQRLIWNCHWEMYRDDRVQRMFFVSLRLFGWVRAIFVDLKIGEQAQSVCGKARTQIYHLFHGYYADVLFFLHLWGDIHRSRCCRLSKHPEHKRRFKRSYRLFGWVRREKERDREISAFSISHDHELVKIYGRYPVIKGDKATLYRHPTSRLQFPSPGRQRILNRPQNSSRVFMIIIRSNFRRVEAVQEAMSCLSIFCRLITILIFTKLLPSLEACSDRVSD